MGKWYCDSGDSITVSTRIRLARNLEGIPFPSRMSVVQLQEINEKVVDALMSASDEFSKRLNVIKMDEIDDITARAMVERHIISPDFASNRNGRILVVSEDETISVMICEEDHLRIQVIRPSLALQEAYDIADKIDNLLSEKLPIAFNEKLGYLTECPTNLGTGLRASVMLHLPALESLGEISILAENASKIGLTIRGLYGEGSGSQAALYQVSNQVTLGISEKAALENLLSITQQIISREEQAIKRFDDVTIQDSVFRSLGVLQNARILTSAEMMKHISKIMLGQRLKYIKLTDKNLPIKLLIETQPGMLALQGEVDADKRDQKRAEIIRSGLK
ncbi:MAG: protein arginine kinase [bacterium]|nr:protein arginine kinase [bacterium]